MKEMRDAGLCHLCGAVLLLCSVATAGSQEKPTRKLADRLYFEADDFTAQLPWFYHDLVFDATHEHNVHSIEVNSLDLRPGNYKVTLVPKSRDVKLAVGFDGKTFSEMPVKDGRVDLPGTPIRNRMLGLYVRTNGDGSGGPLESVWVYPSNVTLAEARESAVLFKRYRRDIRYADREILWKENWDEFYGVLNRRGFGKKELRAMFNDIVDWCKRRQVLDPNDIHYGAVYSEEDKYDFRDAAAAAVCFTYAWRDTGDDDYRRRAVLARDYCYKGQHMSDPNNTARFGGFCHMVHGAWGPGMQRLGGELGGAVWLIGSKGRKPSAAGLTSLRQSVAVRLTASRTSRTKAWAAITSW